MTRIAPAQARAHLWTSQRLVRLIPDLVDQNLSQRRGSAAPSGGTLGQPCDGFMSPGRGINPLLRLSLRPVGTSAIREAMRRDHFKGGYTAPFFPRQERPATVLVLSLQQEARLVGRASCSRPNQRPALI